MPKKNKKFSIEDFAISDLLLNEIVLSKNGLTFSGNNNFRFIECNDKQIKVVLNLILNIGKLREVQAIY